MIPTGFCTHADMLLHDTGPRHPERADRLRAVLKAVRDAGLIDPPNPAADFEMDFGRFAPTVEKLIELPARLADESLAELIHPRVYLERLRKICVVGGAVDGGDTIVVPASYRAAMLSLGCVRSCVDAVMSGQVRRAFAAVRPPGHHAEPDRPMGFCLLSNVAIAARYLQSRYNVERIAIVDFDVHHGNGTQACFDHDPSVFFASLHQNPRTLYPGSGHDWEIGMGNGRGTTLNVLFNPGAEDGDYQAAMEKKIIPALDQFRPQMLLISAGFDAHTDDPLADINLTESGFSSMTQSLTALADRHCEGRLISVLEGGYNLRALGRCVVAHLRSLQEAEV